MKRYLHSNIIDDLKEKIVLVSGPRQAGKTTLSKMLVTDYEYLNYDYAPQRLKIREQSWDRTKKLLILDEVHKMPSWKQFIKGIYDVEGLSLPILVTGSARLDTIKKVGDSLAGRYFQYRLHPFDIKELKNHFDPKEILNRLLSIGGFPEPFLKNSKAFYNRWKNTHLDIILRQDLIDLESVRDIQGIELLIELLKSRVGTPVSYSSLARDLQKNHNTVKKWLALLENLYVIFPVRPWHKNIARAILKEPKYYFYDTGQILADESIRLENVVATALLKEIHFLEDTTGCKASLHYVRNKQGYEIDFAVSINKVVTHFIEVKLSDTNLSKSFGVLLNEDKSAKRIQLVKNTREEKTYPSGAEVREVSHFLANLKLEPVATIR